MWLEMNFRSSRSRQSAGPAGTGTVPRTGESALPGTCCAAAGQDLRRESGLQAPATPQDHTRQMFYIAAHFSPNRMISVLPYVGFTERAAPTTEAFS